MNTWTDSPNVVQRAVRRIIATRPVTWALSHTMHHLDRAAMRASGGRITAGALFTGLPLITLTTIGAKSGRPRSVPLVGIPDGERLILVASNWGQARHPAWYHNVKAHPEVAVAGRDVPLERLGLERLGLERLPEEANPPSRGDVPAERLYIARELTGAEREAAWARATAVYPGYRGYAARTGGRAIPIILLEPSVR